MSNRLALGAPGIYVRESTAQATLVSVRMDICAFVGVAPRGPAREPRLPEAWTYDRPSVGHGFALRRSLAVPVESFEEYRRLYGGFEGPGRLPYAVASFFQQGGKKAYIVRIVHEYGDSDGERGTARGAILGATTSEGALTLRARNEGVWGNALRAGLAYRVIPLQILLPPEYSAPRLTSFVTHPEEYVPPGSLLRLTLATGERAFAVVSDISDEPLPDRSGRQRRVTLDRPMGAFPRQAEIIEGTLLLDGGHGFEERHERLGLAAGHPRWAATVLSYESDLVFPDASWIEGTIIPDDIDDLPDEPVLPPIATDARQFEGGEDLYRDLVPQDFFDDSWVRGKETPGDGIRALAHQKDVASLVVPDLYHPFPVPEVDLMEAPRSLAGGAFTRCVDYEPPPAEPATGPGHELEGLILDPSHHGDLLKIVSLQLNLVRAAEEHSNLVVLLDVPPGLPHRDVLRWRSRFQSSYAAAYHPWLKLAQPTDERTRLIRLNPAAVAAGMIARQERQFGVPHGPANLIARGIVDVMATVSPTEHDELHPQGINVFRRERDGIRLTAARTLAHNRQYRQLSVRRLMIMLRRVLEEQTQWLVFEPNGPSLRADVRFMLKTYLRGLYRAGAFVGATEQEAFFIRCDEVLNSQIAMDAGQLIAEIGVAPSEPTEFIVVRLETGADRTLTLEL